jgi:hypothetical protein
MKGHFAAISLTVIGALALAVNLELIELDLVHLLRKWWPLALIGLGLAMYFTPDDQSRQKKPD